MKVREGNDISITWVIMQDELTPLNTEGIYDGALSLVWGKIEKEINTGVTRKANSIRIEITPVLAPYRGQYFVLWRYRQSDPAFRDGFRNRVIAEKIFTIVDSTHKSDDTRDFTVTTILTQ